MITFTLLPPPIHENRYKNRYENRYENRYKNRYENKYDKKDHKSYEIVSTDVDCTCRISSVS
jgi:hypothetical protein